MNTRKEDIDVVYIGSTCMESLPAVHDVKIKYKNSASASGLMTHEQLATAFPGVNPERKTGFFPSLKAKFSYVTKDEPLIEVVSPNTLRKK